VGERARAATAKPSENKRIKTDEEGREAQREELPVLVLGAFTPRRAGDPETAAEGMAGDPGKGDMLFHAPSVNAAFTIIASKECG
jgi:hypothetical protein